MYELVNEKVYAFGSVNQFESSQTFKSLEQLSGCFVKDGTIGQIYLSPFKITIKSLVSSFNFSKSLSLSGWKDICGYMRKTLSDNLESPEQLVDLITA